MKSLVRWSATLGLVGSTLLGSVFLPNLPAQALTEEQIVQKLRTVPVFVITTPEGDPLTRSVTEGQNKVYISDVYLSGQEAQKVINDLRNLNTTDPEQARLVQLARTLQVRPFPLALIYQELRENADQPNRLRFAFQPVQQDWNAALDLLRRSGQQADQLDAVPLFLVRFGPDQGYVAVQRSGNNQDAIIPVFFSQQEAQNLLSQVKREHQQADIQVVDINRVIGTLRDGNDQQLDKVELIPSREALEFVRSLQPASPAPANQQQRPQR